MMRRLLPILRACALVLVAALAQGAATSHARAAEADAQGAASLQARATEAVAQGGAPSQPLAAEAAAAYAQGRYIEAARSYGALASHQGVSASLYYDLGAAQLGAGEIGPALLSFERAHWLAPGDPGIEAALHMARERAGLPAREIAWWQRARSIAGPDAWVVAAAVLLFAACAGASLRLLDPESLRLRPAARRAALAATAVSGAALVVASLACATLALETSRAVTLAPDLALRIAPFDGAESRGTLAAGEVVRIGERHGEFVRVRTGAGGSGWVARRGLARVAAPES